MKQRITIEQLNTLTDAQKKRLREWWKPQTGDFFQHESGWDITTQRLVPDDSDLPLLSIGQMIDIIKKQKRRVSITTYESGWEAIARNGDKAIASIKEELSDALWVIVKDII